MMPSVDRERFTQRCLRYVFHNSDVELVNMDIDLSKLNWQGGAPALVFWMQIIGMTQLIVVLSGRLRVGLK